MPVPETLTVELLSDTTFGRGEGTAGEVDAEVEHDRSGLPFVRGKVLHGLLRDAWLSMRRHFEELAPAARRVLGAEADLTDAALLRIGDALLPADVRAWAGYAVRRERDRLRPDEVLQTLTDVRRQTAVSRWSGAPEETTLRAARVILRGTVFHAPLTWLAAPNNEDVRVLALCVLGIRHGGLSRNRGRGFLGVTLDGDLAATRRLVAGEGGPA